MTNQSPTTNIDFEIQFLEGVLQGSPRFVEALKALGDLYTKKGYYEKGLAIDQRLFTLRPYDPIVLYNLSCSYSLVKNINLAFVMMKKAIKCGYRDFEHIERDQDLSNLKKDSRFRRFLSKAVGKENGREQVRDHE